MSIEFFQTIMGKKFYEADVPRIVRALERIAAAVEEQNDLVKRWVKEEENRADVPPVP